MTPARDPKQFLCSKPKESWKRDKGGGVIEQQSLRRYHGRGIAWKRNHGKGISEEELRRRNHGGGIKEKESWRRNHGGGIMGQES